MAKTCKADDITKSQSSGLGLEIRAQLAFPDNNQAGLPLDLIHVAHRPQKISVSLMRTEMSDCAYYAGSIREYMGCFTNCIDAAKVYAAVNRLHGIGGDTAIKHHLAHRFRNGQVSHVRHRVLEPPKQVTKRPEINATRNHFPYPRRPRTCKKAYTVRVRFVHVQNVNALLPQPSGQAPSGDQIQIVPQIQPDGGQPGGTHPLE